MMWRLLAVGLISYVLFIPVESCNEAVCASVVSKCMLIQSCNCDLKNCSCCKECFTCLSHLYSECCSCVDMCPKPNETASELGKESHIEDFGDSFPSLFAALTNEPDPDNRWVAYTFPADHSALPFAPKLDKEVTYHTQSSEQNITHATDLTFNNCTVVFLNECTTSKKCSDTCRSMGSESCRWFHDGCCECIGPKCLDYGIKESRCLNCSANLNFEDDGDDYGGDYN